MGNHGSRRGQRRQRNDSTGSGGKAVHALKRVEELRGPPVDAHDKLIAWLAEMAENDNMQLDTSLFVKQLTRVCGTANANNNGYNPTGGGSGGGGGGGGGGSDRGSGSGMGLVGGGRRSSALRQNSTSCESRASSSDTHRYSVGRSTRSFEDTLDPRQSWRHALSSRQATCSDDLEEDPDVRNASMESLYSGSDRDSEVESMPATYCAESTSTRRARFLQQREQREMRRPLLRQALLGSSTCSSTGGGDGEGSGRVGAGARSGPRASYPGYGSCHTRSSMMGLSSGLMPVQLVACSASTGDLDKLNTSLDETTGEEIPARLLARRRSVSLLNLTPPGRAAYYVPDAPPPDTPPASAPPTKPAEQLFLDDTLLDGNMADIMFAVEALWPKK
nr:hypothetical protein BaRGS_023888 [Batillaria attramentaria]